MFAIFGLIEVHRSSRAVMSPFMPASGAFSG